MFDVTCEVLLEDVFLGSHRSMHVQIKFYVPHEFGLSREGGWVSPIFRGETIHNFSFRLSQIGQGGLQ